MKAYSMMMTMNGKMNLKNIVSKSRKEYFPYGSKSTRYGCCNKSVGASPEKEETETEIESTSEVETSSVADDPWADVDHSEEE